MAPPLHAQGYVHTYKAFGFDEASLLHMLMRQAHVPSESSAQERAYRHSVRADSGSITSHQMTPIQSSMPGQHYAESAASDHRIRMITCVEAAAQHSMKSFMAQVADQSQLLLDEVKFELDRQLDATVDTVEDHVAQPEVELQHIVLPASHEPSTNDSSMSRHTEQVLPSVGADGRISY